MAEQPSPMKRFVSAAMIAVGALITFLSGACTGYFLLASLSSRGGDLLTALVSLGVGLPFVGLGLALFFGGRAMSRR